MAIKINNLDEWKDWRNWKVSFRELQKVTEERQRAEGSYAEGILIFDLLSATGFKAPKFIYETRKKYVFRDAQRSANTTSLLNPRAFIYGDT